MIFNCGVAVGVPGELRGWESLHQKNGKLPWAKLFDGAIKLARCGFTVNHYLAAALNNGGSAVFTIDRGELTYHLPATYPFLTTDPAWALRYAPNGTLLGQGDIAYRKRYADTLELFV